MKYSGFLTKAICGVSLAGLAIVSATNVTAACAVWWQQRCCAKAGIVGVPCGTPPTTWRCYHNLLSDPAVGTITNSTSGWDGPWGLGFSTCTYYEASCGPNPGNCIYAIPPISANCVNIGAPVTPPTCP